MKDYIIVEANGSKVIIFTAHITHVNLQNNGKANICVNTGSQNAGFGTEMSLQDVLDFINGTTTE